MSLAEITEELPRLSSKERIALVTSCLRLLSTEMVDHKKTLERLLRRLQNPDIPEDVWAGFEDIEDGRVVDMETALFETPPEYLKGVSGTRLPSDFGLTFTRFLIHKRIAPAKPGKSSRSIPSTPD